MIIYKITNIINNKVYIGLTTVSLKERWTNHKTSARVGVKRHLYNSMRFYGIDKFVIEQIDSANSLEELGAKERYYINLYNSRDPNVGYNITAGGERNQYDANPRATLTLEEVVQIREIYSQGELSCMECWEIYKSKISYSAFQKVWEGTTWKGILDEVYTKDAKQTHIKQASRPGELNPNAKLTDDEVLNIRIYYMTHTLVETFNKFGSLYKSVKAFRGVVDRGHRHLPVYSKIKKKWFLKGKEINIEDYKPVSTISESGE